MNDMKKKYIQYMIKSLTSLDKSLELSDDILDLKNKLISELENQLNYSINDEIKIYNTMKESLNTVKTGINTIYGNKYGINDKIDDLYDHIDSCIEKLSNYIFDDSYSIDTSDEERFIQELLFVYNMADKIKENISRNHNEHDQQKSDYLHEICESAKKYILLISESQTKKEGKNDDKENV